MITIVIAFCSFLPMKMILAFFQVSVELRDYEEAVQEAAEAGLLVSFVADIIVQNDRAESTDLPPVVTERWSVLQAIFFASTVLTTIGQFLRILKQLDVLLAQRNLL